MNSTVTFDITSGWRPSLPDTLREYPIPVYIFLRIDYIRKCLNHIVSIMIRIIISRDKFLRTRCNLVGMQVACIRYTQNSGVGTLKDFARINASDIWIVRMYIRDFTKRSSPVKCMYYYMDGSWCRRTIVLIIDDDGYRMFALHSWHSRIFNFHLYKRKLKRNLSRT